MTHQRTTIRNALVTLLDTGSIVASGKVFSNRPGTIWEESLPEIYIFNQPEDSSRHEFGDQSNDLMRDFQVAVTVIATNADGESLDDTLDGLAESIEDALKADDTWNGTVTDAFLSRTETEINEDSGGKKPMGAARLTYTCRYFA